MKTQKAKKIYWGLVLIAVAVFGLLKCIGVEIGIIGTFSFVDLVLAAIILAIAVGSAIKCNFWALPLELAVLFMLLEKPIALYCNAPDTNLVNNWLLLGCAVLVSIGLSLIFPDTIKGSHLIVSADGKNTKFGTEAKYIDCTDFTSYSYSVKMGDGSIYFENIENYKGNGVLNVSCKMGNLTIHVPSAWHLQANIETNLGGTEVPGTGSLDGPLLTINGTNKMGDITVKFC